MSQSSFNDIFKENMEPGFDTNFICRNIWMQIDNLLTQLLSKKATKTGKFCKVGQLRDELGYHSGPVKQ